MKVDVPTKICELLEKVVNGNIEDYSVDVYDANKKGEGFLGDFCYVSVKGKNSEESYDLAIKQAFGEDSIRSLFPIRDYFLNEIHFYTEVWPRFQKLQSEYSIEEPFNNIAKCYATSSDDKNEKLVFENLKQANFQIHPKNLPLDEEHFEFIFKRYGKFHGISFACKLLDPQGYSEISKGLRCSLADMATTDAFVKYIDIIAESCVANLQSEEDASVLEKFQPYIKGMSNIQADSFRYKGDYSAILHGDCWSNNMMFKYNESNELVDIRLLDFQFSSIGTPVSDLSYCLYSGGTKEIFDKLDHYLRLYHTSLLDTLEGFGCRSENVYPFEELKKDWKKYSKAGFTMGLALWQTKLTKSDDIKDLNDYKDVTEEEKDQAFKVPYDEESYRERSRDLIFHMYENDFL